MSLRSLLQDRMAALNGRTVEYVLKQDLAAFVRLIGLSVAQARAPNLNSEAAPQYGRLSGTVNEFFRSH